MKKIVAISCYGIIAMLGLTCMLSINTSKGNTEKITNAIEEKETQDKETVVYETTNNYETHNHYEVEPKKEVVVEREVIVEKVIEKPVTIIKEVEKPVPEQPVQKETQEPVQKKPVYDKGITEVLKCEVCEKSGTELKVWYDSNNIKHITCKDRCTNGLGALYGE